MSNSQSSQRPDLQDLVAYMQGRGSEALRAQVLKRLDEDESYLELMMDLVPMLREAGELADPDAVPGTAPAAPPAAAPLVSPAASPAAAPPARVVPFPESPSRRRTAAISLIAAMIPAAVAIWIATNGPGKFSPRKLASHVAVSEVVVENNSLWGDSTTRGATKDVCDRDPAACFDAGAQMFELELAIGQGWTEKANARLANLATTLGEEAFDRYFPGLADAPDGSLIDLEMMEKQIEAGSRQRQEDLDSRWEFEQGACLRAAFLAAKGNDRKFFQDRKKRKLCRESVGDELWKAEPDPIENRYFDVRDELVKPR